jgi:hypothetical protein
MNNRNLALIFIFVLSSQGSFAQHGGAVTKLSGILLAPDSARIPYAHICHNTDRSIGTYSDSNGQFEFRFSLPKTDTVLFSCIGYEDFRLPLTSHQLYSDSQVIIVLTPKAYLLEEIIISSDTALSIVKEAVKRLSDNLSEQRNILQGFYREVIRSDHTYDRLVEAAVDVFDKGYGIGSGNRGLEFRIRELRKSEDYVDLDWRASIISYLSPPNGLYGSGDISLFTHDYIRNNVNRFSPLINAPLNERFFDYVNFSFDSLIDYGTDSFYCIGINPKKRDGLLPEGKIYIRRADFAIFQIEYMIKAGKEALQTFQIQGEDELLHKTTIKYVEYNGKMFLSLLYRKSFRTQMNYTKFSKSEGEEGLFYHEQFYMTNEIIAEKYKPNKFRKKEKQNMSIDLYNQKWKYNSAFWETYNVINENPLQPNIKKDLERETSLEQQFIKND